MRVPDRHDGQPLAYQSTLTLRMEKGGVRLEFFAELAPDPDERVLYELGGGIALRISVNNDSMSKEFPEANLILRMIEVLKDNPTARIVFGEPWKNEDALPYAYLIGDIPNGIAQLQKAFPKQLFPSDEQALREGLEAAKNEKEKRSHYR